jgi:hypothetical protein
MLAFAFGLFICYITEPQKEIIIKFPSPVNAGKVVYRGKNADECYKYNVEKLNTCPHNAKPQPVLEDFQSVQKYV